MAADPFIDTTERDRDLQATVVTSYRVPAADLALLTLKHRWRTPSSSRATGAI